MIKARKLIGIQYSSGSKDASFGWVLLRIRAVSCRFLPTSPGFFLHRLPVFRVPHVSRSVGGDERRGKGVSSAEGASGAYPARVSIAREIRGIRDWEPVAARAARLRSVACLVSEGRGGWSGFTVGLPCGHRPSLRSGARGESSPRRCADAFPTRDRIRSLARVSGWWENP